MFALAGDGRLRGLLEEAGFQSVRLERIPLPSPYPSLGAYLDTMAELSGIFRTAWERLDDGQRAAVTEHARGLVAPFTDTDGSFELAGQALVATAEA